MKAATNDIVIGAAAGVVATVPMTITMEELHRLFPPERGLYALAVWSGAYLGVLPRLGVRHHAKHDSVERSAVMIAAHVVWGATLGLILRGGPGLHVASRHPRAVEG